MTKEEGRKLFGEEDMFNFALVEFSEGNPYMVCDWVEHRTLARERAESRDRQI